MDVKKYNFYKSTNELLNSLIATLSFQLNLIKIEPKIFTNNFDEQSLELSNIKNYRICNNYFLYMINIAQDFDSNYGLLLNSCTLSDNSIFQQLEILVKIDDSKMNSESLTKIVDKCRFCLKSSIDYICLLYPNLNLNLESEIIKFYNTNINNISSNHKCIVIINDLEATIYLYNETKKVYYDIFIIKLVSYNNCNYCYIVNKYHNVHSLLFDI